MFKIFHTADIQVEIRRNSQRYDEYASALEQMYKVISTNLELRKVSIDGDLFEFNSVTETERNLIINWILRIDALPHIFEIVIHSGNHDLKQRFNDIQISGENITEDSVIDSLKISFKGNPKIQVFTKSGFYPSVDPSTPSLLWGVHAHEHKFNGTIEYYSPWVGTHEMPDPNTVIELFHDPFNGAIGFNGQVQHGCENALGFERFKAKTILAGDIHQPQQIKVGNQVFTFPSSPVMRDFGEGDYYINTERAVKGLDNHGYYIHTISDDFATLESTFHPLDVHTTRITIQIDSKFPYDKFEDLKIKHVSPFKNLVRINVLGAETHWHEHSSKIIEHLSAQCPNLELTVDIDSSSIFAETGEALELELDKLVTEDQLLDIAIPFIQKRIRDTKKILPEDKDEAERTTVEMFKQQLTKIRKTIERNSVRFGKLSASNFLSYGDDVEIDFRTLKNLVKISGTNGVGKTNIMKLIKWITDDVIDSSQARNTVNQNAMDIFNDKRLDKNTVDASFTFDCNGKNYILTKTVERSYKARVKDEITAKNWKEHVKSITIAKTLVIRSIDGETTLTDMDLIQTELKAIFGSVQDMESLLFTNATLLDALVKSNPDALADQIMHILGLRYFQDMAAEYDSLRKDKLSELAKPSESIEALTLSVAQLKEVKEKSDTFLTDLEITIAVTKSDVEKYTKEVGDLREKLVPVQYTPEELATKIETVEKAVEGFKENITKSQAEISALELRQMTENEDFDGDIEKLIKDRSEVLQQIEVLKGQLSVLQVKNDALKTDAVAISNQLKSDRMIEIAGRYSDLIKARNEGIIQRNTAREAILTTINEAKHAFELKRNNDRVEIETRLTSAQNILNQANTKLHTDKSMLLMYEGSTMCKECKQELKGDAVNEINQRIEERKVMISESEKVIAEVTPQIESISKELETEYFAEDITSWINRTYAQQLTEIRTFISEIDALKAEIKEHEELKTKEENNVAELVKLDPKYTEALDALKTSLAAIETLNKEIEAQSEKDRTETDRIDAALTVIRNKKTAFAQIATDITTQKENITLMESNIVKYEGALDTLRGQLVSIEANKEIKLKIDVSDAKLQQSQSLLQTQGDELVSFKMKLAEANSNIERKEKDISDLIKYRIMESSLSIYKTFIGKTGLNKLIFEAVSKKLNQHMNDLLSDSPYKLAFIDGVLKLIDSTDINNPVTRTASAFSGMQIILGGLSLFYVLRNASLGTKYDCVFIDEISGPLNDGKDLTYKAIDYKALLVSMIGKMTESSKVLIVDHYLNFDDGSILEVYPTDSGASIKVIS